MSEKFIKESNVREDFEGNKNPELASLMKKDHKKGKKSKDKKSKEHQCPQSDAKFVAVLKTILRPMAQMKQVQQK